MSTQIFLLVLTAAVLHASWNYAARKVEGNDRVVWLGMWAACLFALPLVVWLLLTRDWTTLVPQGSWGFVIATGILHAAYFLLLASAYRTGELSVVYPVARGTGVVLTAILAPLLFAESMTALGIMGIVTITFGVLLMSRASAGGTKSVRPALMALCVGVTIAAYSLTDKGGVSHANPVIYIWLMYVVCALSMAPFISSGRAVAWGQTIRKFWREILIIGIGSMGTYLIILYAFSLGPVGYVVGVREFSVVVGAVLGAVFLKEAITPRKVAAIAMVVIGVILIRLS